MKILLTIFTALMFGFTGAIVPPKSVWVTANPSQKPNTDFIKWVDFNASAKMIEEAYLIDIATKEKEFHVSMAEVLAYISLKNGNKFNIKSDLRNLKQLKIRLETENMQQIAGANKYYKYYLDVYNCVFKGFMGYMPDGTYSLKAFFPLAAGFWYSGSDDFGNSRAYGFKRRHLGHDFFAGLGTPVIAVEGGSVLELGWNRYGGWRVGISSDDNARYYYYAHLKKGSPFHCSVKKGERVKAGQVIGYVGATGYSYKPDINMKTKPHLHFGLQLIFDQSQRDGNGEIWIDVYQISRFLAKYNKIKAVKDAETGEFNTIYNT